MSGIKIAGSVALVTGANRGIGRALVDALVARGASKVYACARDPKALQALSEQHGSRVVALKLDVTDSDSVAAAARAANDVSIVVNNAGVLQGSDLTSDQIVDQARNEMEVNYFGPLRVLRHFTSNLAARKGFIVNIGSSAGLTNVPFFPTYSASKAALHSLTQASRMVLAGRGISVLGVYAGPVDTDMTRQMPFQKSTTESVARLVLDGIEAGTEDIFPDPYSIEFGAEFQRSPKNSERMVFAMLSSPPQS